MSQKSAEVMVRVMGISWDRTFSSLPVPQLLVFLVCDTVDSSSLLDEKQVPTKLALKRSHDLPDLTL